MIFISEDEKKTPEMEKFESETGKKAIWRGIITKEFEKWQQGEKIYTKDKERINILISEAKKNKWQDFINRNNISSLSKFIRDAVDFYMNIKPKMEDLEKFSKAIHNLKGELSSIKGFSQLLIEEHKDELSWDALLKVKEIIDNSKNIEKLLNDIFDTHKLANLNYDVLIVDDDPSTINLISKYFKNKGFAPIDTGLGNKALEILKKIVPKLILIDILLPDISGYDLCMKIKSDKRLKDVPVFYITAVPEAEVHEKMNETKANGYILKPFDISQFESLLSYL